jgi:hypothetical protein
VVVGIWALSIILLLFALFYVIKARKLERRALILIERLERKAELERRFSGRKQNQSLTVDRAAARRALRPNPARFV